MTGQLCYSIEMAEEGRDVLPPSPAGIRQGAEKEDFGTLSLTLPSQTETTLLTMQAHAPPRPQGDPSS